MKRWLARAVDFALYGTVAALLYGVVSRSMSGPSEGSSAAAFDLPLVGRTGERFRLQDHRGKPVLIEVFASWCGACEHSAPTMNAAYTKHRKDGLVFVGVSVDGSPEEAARVQRDWQVPYDVVLDDGRMSKDYKIQVLPTLVLVNREGQIERVATGIPSSATLDKWLTEL